MTGIFSAIKLILRVWDLIEQLIAGAKAKDAANWDRLAEEMIRSYAAMATAKTPEEKDSAKKRVADSWLTR